jgi:hypothetical protein
VPISFSRDHTELLAVLRERDSKHGSKLEDILLGAFFAISNLDNPDRFAQAAQSMRELLDRLPLQYEGAPQHVPVGKAADHMRSVVDQYTKAKSKSKCFDEKTTKWDGNIDPSLRQLLEKLGAIVEERQNVLSAKERKRRFIRQLDPTGEPLPEPNEDFALKMWRGYDDYFQLVAHHNRQVQTQDFEDRLNGCVRMLLNHLKPATSTTLDALDALIKEAEGT